MTSKQINGLLLGSMAILIVALVWLVADTSKETVIEAGDKAPSFSIKTDDGRIITPTNFGGRYLMVNFWASWCAPCVEEAPSLDQLTKQLKSSGVVVLGISVDKNEAAYKRFLGRLHPSFLTALDPSANISSDFGTFKYPETYIIDAQGKVVMKVIGPRNWTEPETLKQVTSLL